MIQRYTAYGFQGAVEKGCMHSTDVSVRKGESLMFRVQNKRCNDLVAYRPSAIKLVNSLGPCTLLLFIRGEHGSVVPFILRIIS